jgi:hypothetical protein
LCRVYPILYELCLNQNISVYNVANDGWVIHFKIRLPPIIRDQWYELVAHLNTINLNENSDKPIWKWTDGRQFSVKSVYEHLTREYNGPAHKDISKAKIPEKVKIFMWLTAQKVILTKDNMIRRRWQGGP